MKKIYSWTLVLITVLTAGFALTSCDDDLMQANTLSGQWRGNFGMYYTDKFGYEWDADYTVIEFYNNGWGASGTGQQCDYYLRGPYAYQYYKFNWSIKNGYIYLTYPGAHELDATIYDYRMSYNTFSGYFGDSNSTFTLYKYDDFRWDSYSGYGNYYGNYNYGYTYGGYNYDSYYYNGGYYYGKKRTETATNDTPAPAVQGDDTNIIVKRGNRLNENKNNY